MPPARTKCGTARNLPPVINSNASPVWKPRHEAGISTFVMTEFLDLIYRPADGDGTEGKAGRGGRELMPGLGSRIGG